MLENGSEQQIKLIKHLERVEGLYLFIKETLHVASFVGSKAYQTLGTCRRSFIYLLWQHCM